MRRIDLTGERFGRLKVIRMGDKFNGRTAWLCECDCGNMVLKTTNDLRQGKTHSCGCVRKELAASQASKAGKIRGAQLKKHGYSNTRLYNIWKSMRQRCNNPHDDSFADYGGRGIKICSEWNDFENFRIWAINNGYDPNAKIGECTIDRINNNSGYSPDNCRWTDMKQQAVNRRKKKCLKS